MLEGKCPHSTGICHLATVAGYRRENAPAPRKNATFCPFLPTTFTVGMFILSRHQSSWRSAQNFCSWPRCILAAVRERTASAQQTSGTWLHTCRPHEDRAPNIMRIAPFLSCLKIPHSLLAHTHRHTHTHTHTRTHTDTHTRTHTRSPQGLLNYLVSYRQEIRRKL